ncbi:ferrochelatase [Legionella impletisoli]|uniref:Ferrochelatase n=1 Tax=Legionella impletisoli TaxID=343510 RepID=A0A917NCU3_9GAMM|nr:ferrochelatase [Legionella impletisoli]GGI90140.1 ferrochelatase [Legionella impletisoli]
MKKGLLLINIGTPKAPKPSDVRLYLREFLSDKRVVHLPALLRYILLYGIILPTRPKRSAKAYQAIWTKEGSPLLMHCETLTRKLQETLSDTNIVLGMRYGKPSLESALDELADCEHIIILPLYPQYSSAATGSSLEKALQLIQRNAIIPSLTIIRDFHQHPAFIKAQAELIKPYIDDQDMILFSYHGVPENHLLRGSCKSLCSQGCSIDSSQNPSCYRAQCLRTTEAIAKQLELSSTTYLTSFQSRLGKTRWIEPYTDKVLVELAEQGVKKLAVTCPSFVADCLETLEEIGIQAQAQWQKLGGETFTLIPCLNANEAWVEAITQIIQSPTSISPNG